MWYKTESGVKPELLDTTSSKTYNYARRNIAEEQRKEGIVYVYEEIKVPKESWYLYLENVSLVDQLEQANANIGYVAMMTDVDIPESEEA